MTPRSRDIFSETNV